ncbi:MAG: hypothetical protein ACLR9P_00340 [Escherichia coli]
MTCENNTAVKMGFFGDTTPGNDRALALTKQEDSASGVGIELLYGDNTGSVRGRWYRGTPAGVSIWPGGG